MATMTTPSRVDRQTGVMRNVKLIGFESRNGRYYPPEVLKNAVHLYEGAKVNIDHPERGPAAERKVSDRIGVIRNARFVEGRGVYGDFHYNPHHPMAERLAWDAENNPAAMGFSHNATMRMGRPDRKGNEVVESIIAIRSIDLVADPATTTSLFESFRLSDKNSPMSQAFRQLIIAIISDESLSMAEQMQKIKIALETQQAINRDEEGEANEEANAEKDRQLKEKLKKIRTGIESTQPSRPLPSYYVPSQAEQVRQAREAMAAGLTPLASRFVIPSQAEQARHSREAELRRMASRLKR